MKIKIGIRHNLFYPLMVIIFTFFRKLDSIMMAEFIEFNGSLLLIMIMFLSELITGLFFLLYYTKNISEHKNSRFLELKLINNKMNPPDNAIKIYFLIFLIAYFDFVIFLLQMKYLSQIQGLSKSLDLRVKGSLIISSAIMCYFLLRIKIYKHQKCTIFIILFCFLIVIISEFFFEIFLKKGNEIKFIKVLLFNILLNIFISFMDIIEKYVLEVDYINAFHLLMLEGIFGFILTFIYSFFDSPFKETKIIYENKEIKYFILLIVFFVIYFITSGGRNIYRVITNKIYSPMARTLTDSFLDPLFIIIYYYGENDFRDSNNKKILHYFIINLIISIIVVFCGVVYNELLILFCCNLEHETYHQISKRAKEAKFSNAHELMFELDDNYYSRFEK